MNTTQDTAATTNVEPATRARCGGAARRCGGQRGGALRLLAFVVVGGLGFLAGHATAHEHGPGGFFGGPGMGMLGGAMEGEFDPARAEARIERMAKHLAVEAEATPAQQEKLAAIAKAAAKDLAAIRAAMREQRQRTMALLAAPTVDRAQLEAARADQMKRADEISKRVTRAVAEAAEVLTPEQRKKLAEHIAERRRHGPMGMGGGMSGPAAS